MDKSKKDIRFFNIIPQNEDAQTRLNILNVLKRNVPLDIDTIVEKSGVSDAAATGYVDLCAKNNLLKKCGTDKGETVKFNDDKSKVLGVGFSGGQCILTVMDLNGNILTKEQIGIGPFPLLRRKVKEIKESISKISRETKLIGSGFRSIGVAVPEQIGELNVKGPDILAEGISDIFNQGVLIAKEATAAGYGEKDFGDQTGNKDMLYMYTDAGTGVIIKSEMIFEADGEKRESRAYLRPWGQFNIASTAKSLVDKGVGTSIVNMVDGDTDKISLEVVLEAAEKHDELAEDLVKRSGLALGVRIAYLANMFNTTMVVLGGGTEQEKGGFTRFVKESTQKFLLKNLVDRLEIVPGVLGGEASSIGAASLCRRELFMEA